MNIGVPFETLGMEHRVGLTPFGASRLTRMGREVYVQHKAGVDSHFLDEDYTAAGAQIVFSAEEVYQRAEIVCRIGALRPDELDLVPNGGTICGFHHFAMAPREVFEPLIEKEATLIGYELLEDEAGDRPVLIAFSEIAGGMVVHTAAHLLEHDSGGRGLVLGGAPGIPPATVVILGAGTLGRTAARRFIALGAHVIVLDAELPRLREVYSIMPGVVTAIASHRNLGRFTAIADVVVGAVLVPGARAPYLVTEAMVKEMKEGSVILDLAIDQGGCVETSRPTHPEQPTYEMHGVTHYCVPNMTANVPRTASRALANAALPFVIELSKEGVEATLRADPGFAAGLSLYRGMVVNEQTARSLGVEHVPVHEALARGAGR